MNFEHHNTEGYDGSGLTATYILWTTLKFFFALVICLVALLVYKFVISPVLIRRKYRKYSNMHQTESLQLWKGDLATMEENIEKKAFTYWHYAEIAMQKEKKYDFCLKFYGPMPLYVIFSPKAIREVIQMMPNKIDREESYFNKIFGKIFLESFLLERSNDNWKHRRNTVFKTLGINFSSKFIPLLLKCFDDVVSTWKVGPLDFTERFAECQFLFSCKMLFGDDFTLETDDFNYLHANGQYEKMNMRKIFILIGADMFAGMYHPIGNIFLSAGVYNLCNPYKRTMENVRELERGLKHFLEHTTDESNSYYAQVKKMNAFTERELISDLLLILFAGTDTSSHTTTSLMYYIDKYPEVKEKCMKEYLSQGVIAAQGLQRNKMTLEILDTCEYSDRTIKEAMRLDHILSESFAIEALEDVQI